LSGINAKENAPDVPAAVQAAAIYRTVGDNALTAIRLYLNDYGEDEDYKE